MATFQYPGVNVNLRYPYRGGDRFADRLLPGYPIGFPEYTQGYSAVLPMREVGMMILMDKLTDKPDWHEKVFDEAIVQKWRDEARRQPEDGLFARIMQGKESEKIPMPKSRIITDKAFDFCIAELRNKARYFAISKLIPTFDGPKNTIVKSDSYIDGSLHKKLNEAFDTLRADQGANVDWHPRSNDMVQDLVHPSMYPFVYGRSPFIQEEVVGVSNALAFIGQGATVPKDDGPQSYRDLTGSDRFRYGVGSGNVDLELWSQTYQWLPANVAFREDGSAKFTSYINNLHPQKYPEIYKTVERFVDSAIGAWDQCLRETIDYSFQHFAGRARSRFEKIVSASDSDDTLWTPEFSEEKFKDADIRLDDDTLLQLETEGSYSTDNPIEVDPEENDRRQAQGLPPLTPNIQDWDLARAKWTSIQEPLIPEPLDYEQVVYTPTQTLREEFKEHGLQVIVKMASIELTPEKPEFPAGGWHLEGQMNEKIAATALYYLDSDNVTSSHLSFAMQTSSYLNDDVNAEQDEYNWLERVYGTSLGPAGGFAGICTQNFGDVETPQGRLLAFPNVFQHAVSSFRLQDATKPGHRRFIALWLIDPHRRVISTANVPPQQKDWWRDGPGSGTLDEGVPEGVMSVEEAREHRLKLMEERTRKEGAALAVPEYSFCEH